MRPKAFFIFRAASYWKNQTTLPELTQAFPFFIVGENFPIAYFTNWHRIPSWLQAF